MPEPMTESKLTTEQQLQSLWSLGGLRVKELTKRVYRGINDDYLLDRASALAYNFILALFPLMLFLLAVFGMFASHSASMSSNLFAYLGKVLPPEAAQVIRKTLTEVTRNAGGAKLTIGILLTFWFASGGMSSMVSGLNGVYEVREGRSFVRVRLIALGLTVAISLLIIAALIAILTGNFVANYLGSHLGLGTLAVVTWHIVQIALGLVFVMFSFSLIYFYSPDLKEQHWYWITPGALIGVLLWVAASFSFRLYLHFFNSYSKTYGSLGAAMILLIWLYITAFSFLIGGEINAQIEHAAAIAGHPEAKKPGEKKAA
jgi:membrane protein